MNYKPDEKDWMAYLYGELEGAEKERIDQYLLDNTEARGEYLKFQNLRKLMSSVEDKEVIAPPIFIDSTRQSFLWNAPYFKLVVSIAASLLLILLAGKLTDTRMSFSNNEFKMSFGDVPVDKKSVEEEKTESRLSAQEVQQMIDAALTVNNSTVQAKLKESQQKLDASIRKNLAVNSAKIDDLVRQAASASEAQIAQYIATAQSQNMQQVKDYFQLTSGEQKQYIEDILVDFSEYLQQQRNNDLQLVQTQLNSLQQNTDVFKQETEQILTSIISSVGTNPNPNGTKN
jgi:hypothetical protein